VPQHLRESKIHEPLATWIDARKNLGVTVEKVEREHTHVMLLAGLGPDGQPVHEQVPVSAGFPAIEDVVDHWIVDRECPWGYGNVYDADDKPLNWWLAP
jgi:hypothetical protein